MKRRGLPWLQLIILGFGLLLLYGAYSTYSDQTTGTKGVAKVSRCETSGSSKYGRTTRCTGSWVTGDGDFISGNGNLVLGRIEGAGEGDIGKEIDVRIHGDDHATKPSLGTPIILLVLGLLVGAFGVFALVMWLKPQPAQAAPTA